MSRSPNLSESPQAPASQLGKKTRAGISWNLFGALVTNGMRIVVIAVLGRALTSADFGVVAVAISVNVILFGLRDVGIGPALVQRQDLAPHHVTTAFAISTYLGVGISLLLVATAPLIADLYHIPESVNVVRALGLQFTLRGVATASRMIAQRSMNFRTIALIDTGAFVAGSITSMVLAVAGAGPWALVIGYLTEEGIATVAYMVTSPTPASLRIDVPRLRELMSYGVGQSIGYLFGTLAGYGDNFVVGNQLHAQQLGYYTRAYDLIKFPSAVFQAIVGTVLFPAFSRLQNDRDRMAVNFRRVTFLNGLVLLPASAVLIVLAPELIRILMGPDWDSAIVPFQILSISMLMRTSQRLCALVSQAAGAVRGVAIVYFIYMVVVVVGAAISIRWGITGVAITTAFAIVVVDIGLSMLALDVTGLRASALLAAHVPGLILAAVVGLVAWPMASALREHGGTMLVFSSVLVTSIALCLVAIALAVRTDRGDLGWLRLELKRFTRGRNR